MAFVFLDLSTTFAGTIDDHDVSFIHAGNGILMWKAGVLPAEFYQTDTTSFTWSGTPIGETMTPGYRDGILRRGEFRTWKTAGAVNLNHLILRSQVGSPLTQEWTTLAVDNTGINDVGVFEVGVDDAWEFPDDPTFSFYDGIWAYGRKTVGGVRLFAWLFGDVNNDSPPIAATTDYVSASSYPSVTEQVVIKTPAGYHSFFWSASGPSRTNNTLWHNTGSGRGLSGTTLPVHQTDVDVTSTNWSLPVARGDTIYIAYAAELSGTQRLYLATYNGTSWSNELVSSTWTINRTNRIALSIDNGGGVFILALGEDPDTASVSRMHVYSRQSSTSSWVHTEITDINFTGAGGKVVTVNMLTTPEYPDSGAYFFVYNQTTVDWYIVYDDGLRWIKDEREPTCEAEPARTNVAFEDEGTSEATISIRPNIVYAEQEDYEVAERTYERGYKNTNLLQTGDRQRYFVKYLNRSTADKDTLQSFFDARRSNVDAWTLEIPPDYTTTKKVALEEGSFSVTQVAIGVWAIEVTAVELLT